MVRERQQFSTSIGNAISRHLLQTFPINRKGCCRVGVKSTCSSPLYVDAVGGGLSKVPAYDMT